MRFLRIAAVAFITGLSGAMMPGPLLALVIGQTAAQGFVAVPGLMLGHALLELITVGFIIAGLQVVLQRRAVRGAIGLGGGAALAWMGVDMIRQASGLALDLSASQAAFGWWKLVIAGAAVCAANPYFIGWWATIGAGGLAHLAPETPGEYLTFYLAHELSDFAWYSVVGLVIISSKLLLQPAVYSILVLACGVIIVALAAWFIYTGSRFVFSKHSASE